MKRRKNLQSLKKLQEKPRNLSQKNLGRRSHKMALLRTRDILKMAEKERVEKLKELKFELVKSGVTANKANAKTKEIKRAISRLITFGKSAKEELNKK